MDDVPRLTLKLSGSEAATVKAALHAAAEIFTVDAQVAETGELSQPNLAAQFRRQAATVREIADCLAHLDRFSIIEDV